MPYSTKIFIKISLPKTFIINISPIFPHTLPMTHPTLYHYCNYFNTPPLLSPTFLYLNIPWKSIHIFFILHLCHLYSISNSNISQTLSLIYPSHNKIIYLTFLLITSKFHHQYLQIFTTKVSSNKSQILFPHTCKYPLPSITTWHTSHFTFNISLTFNQYHVHIDHSYTSQSIINIFHIS